MTSFTVWPFLQQYIRRDSLIFEDVIILCIRSFFYLDHNTYVVGMKDPDDLCSDASKRTVDAKAEENSSTTGM